MLTGKNHSHQPSVGQCGSVQGLKTVNNQLFLTIHKFMLSSGTARKSNRTRNVSGHDTCSFFPTFSNRAWMQQFAEAAGEWLVCSNHSKAMHLTWEGEQHTHHLHPPPWQHEPGCPKMWISTQLFTCIRQSCGREIRWLISATRVTFS